MVSFASENPRRVEAHSTADSLRKDFAELIRIFDRQLEQNRNADTAVLTHIAEAKVAAERGLQLSRELADALRKGRD